MLRPPPPRAHRQAHRQALLFAFAAGALASLSVACSGNDFRPCNDDVCPAVAGQWQLQFEGGPDLGEDCAKLGLGVPQEPLNLTQVGSGLTSELAGVPLRGTLYDTWDFSLHGASEADAGTATVSVNGRFVPEVAAADAGERLQGSYTGNFTQGSTRCIVSRGYTARRTE